MVCYYMRVSNYVVMNEWRDMLVIQSYSRSMILLHIFLTDFVKKNGAENCIMKSFRKWFAVNLKSNPLKK